MRERSIGAGLVAGLALLVAGFALLAAEPLLAQQRQTPAALQPDDPGLNAEDQLAPSQIKQAMPAAVPEPSGAPGGSTEPPPAHAPGHAPGNAARHAAADTAAEPAAAMAKPARPASVRTVVACSGPFAKDSGMLALALAFDSRNVIFTEIDVSGSKVGTSILFPKDPKRRLEVWWSNPNRTGTYLILINGQSTWTGPGGLRLGLTLEQLEKLNNKPFKLKGFDKDNIATVSDWDGGALATLPGGCKSGVSLSAGPKAAADAVSALPADHDYGSADPAMRAVKPTVSEVLIGY
ncbi:MAG: hypothetical protein ABSC37_02990 [Xanthobacteraceae bacterium]